MAPVRGAWEFSLSIQERIREFTAEIRRDNTESDIARHWKYLKNVNFVPSANKSHVEVLNETRNAECDIDGLVFSTIERIESDTVFDDKLNELSKNQLSIIFKKVAEALTDSGFTNFCKIVTAWENVKVLNACFDYVILQKLLEKEEATLSTISAVKELGRSKPELLLKCMIKLITSETNNFTDCELLEQVFDVLPNNSKEELTRAIIQKGNFSESDWQLLQVLSFKTSTSLGSIITFMSSKCEEFAVSQTFARLLVHICKNLQSDKHKEVLVSVIKKNRSLLKHQAMKYLSAL